MGAFPDVYKNLVESRGLADPRGSKRQLLWGSFGILPKFHQLPLQMYLAQEELAVIATYLPILHVLHLTMFFTSAKQMQNLRPSNQLRIRENPP